MQPFLEALRVQRWDDHRFYHHSRVNQSLHLVSAVSFLSAYVMMFEDPAIAALIGWLVAMTSRQIGHFFFEPRDYDVVNQATHEYKEEIKVGYNLRRKVVLMTIWALSPLPLYFDPTFFGVFTPHASTMEFVRHVAQIWLVIGIGGLLFRTVQLFFIKDVQTGLVWAAKILTDPFHDIKLYHKAPLSLLRGEWIDPQHAQSEEWLADDAAELRQGDLHRVGQESAPLEREVHPDARRGPGLRRHQPAPRREHGRARGRRDERRHAAPGQARSEGDRRRLRRLATTHG